MAGPLQNVKIVELGHWVIVPNACTILADWGADVIKIEAARKGNPLRGVTTYDGISPVEKGTSFRGGLEEV